jgi:hypothetical protein
MRSVPRNSTHPSPSEFHATLDETTELFFLWQLSSNVYGNGTNGLSGELQGEQCVVCIRRTNRINGLRMTHFDTKPPQTGTFLGDGVHGADFEQAKKPISQPQFLQIVARPSQFRRKVAVKPELRTDIVIKRFRQEQCLRSVMTGDVRHSTILSWRAPRRNPLRRGFHTVCKTSATAGLGRKQLRTAQT